MEQNGEHNCNESFCTCLKDKNVDQLLTGATSNIVQEVNSLAHISQKFDEVADLIEICCQPNNEDVEEELSRFKEAELCSKGFLQTLREAQQLAEEAHYAAREIEYNSINPTVYEFTEESKASSRNLLKAIENARLIKDVNLSDVIEEGENSLYQMQDKSFSFSEVLKYLSTFTSNCFNLPFKNEYVGYDTKRASNSAIAGQNTSTIRGIEDIDHDYTAKLYFFVSGIIFGGIVTYLSKRYSKSLKSESNKSHT